MRRMGINMKTQRDLRHVERELWQAGCSYIGSVIRGDNSQQEAILAIDDESEFLRLLGFGLEDEGYRVHTASDPNEGIKLYGEQWRNISVVLLDYLLPEMSGDSVFGNLQLFNPDVRVVLVTACEESVAENIRIKGLWGFLQKPFDLPSLAQIVREVANAPAHASAPCPCPIYSSR